MLKYEDLLNKDGLNLQAVQPLLKAEAGRSRHKIVVLDDDPTGVQTLGYRSSDLRDYIEEKTGGRYKKENVHCVSIERLRSMDIDGVENLLMSVSGFDKVVVNAADSCDIKVFCIALYRAIARGKRFLYRTAAGFVKEFAAVEDRTRKPVPWHSLYHMSGQCRRGYHA